MEAPSASERAISVYRVTADACRQERDCVAVEEPLEIRVVFRRNGQRVRRAVSVTMRTPGNDSELAAGFLFTEGLVRKPGQIERIEPDLGDQGQVVEVWLRDGETIALERLQRNFYTTSSCGVCGKASLDAVRTQLIWPLSPHLPELEATVVHALPKTLRQAQTTFTHTGGLHGAALFDASGNLLVMREDVGRHNAVDKVIGARFLAGQLPAAMQVLQVSGRASFELMQKALMAGIPVLSAVGAPSSLAVKMARTFGATLLGFVRDERFNVYSGATRLRLAALKATP